MGFQFLGGLINCKGEESDLAGQFLFRLGLGWDSGRNEARPVLVYFSENTVNPGNCVLKVRCCVSLHGEEFVPRKNIIKSSVLRKVCITHCTQSNYPTLLSVSSSQSSEFFLYHLFCPINSFVEQVHQFGCPSRVLIALLSSPKMVPNQTCEREGHGIFSRSNHLRVVMKSCSK